ncbi:hypothetical protein L1887_52029 [Cichorium endivia]|nr:hypothetical protein L1887_52029 [Cichorium endivia]
MEADGRGGWVDGVGAEERKRGEKKWGQIGNWAVDAKDGLTGRERENVVALGPGSEVPCWKGQIADARSGQVGRWSKHRAGRRRRRVAPPAPVGRPHSPAPSVGLPRIRSRPAIKGESAEAHPLCRLPHLRPQPHLRLAAPANDSTTGWARRDPLNPGSPGPQPAAVRHCRPRDVRVSSHFLPAPAFNPRRAFATRAWRIPDRY